jgi:hypothetical protein
MNVIKRTFDHSDHASMTTFVSADSDKDDLISNMEAWRNGVGTRGFTACNRIAVYDGFPNGGDTWVIRTIRKGSTFEEDALLPTANRLVIPGLLIRLSGLRHKRPLRLVVAV